MPLPDPTPPGGESSPAREDVWQLESAIVDIRAGNIPAGSKLVCTLTGHGLKDPDTAIAQSSEPIAVDATMNAITKLILDSLR